MAAAATGGLSTANTPNGTQINDDESIKKQLQADLNSQTKPQQTDLVKRVKKRKSRDGNESFAGPTDESTKKKQKEKHTSSQKVGVALKSLQEHDLDGSSNGTDLLPKLTNGRDQSGKGDSRLAEAPSRVSSEPASTEKNRVESEEEKKDKVRGESSAAIVPGRASLGSNRDALLQSILKGCGPEKLVNTQAKPAPPLESEIGDPSSTLNVPRPAKTPSKVNHRPKGAMVPTLPKGYTPGPSNSKGSFHCPVEGCNRAYSRRGTLGEHMNTQHRGQRLKDNNNGTMSIISLESYKSAISSGNDEDVFEIPDLFLPTKPANSASRKLNSEEKKITGPGAEVHREDSADSGAPNDTEITSRGEAVNQRRRSSKSKKLSAAGEQTASKISRVKRKSIEKEKSNNGDSSINDGPAALSESSPIRPSNSRGPKRTSSAVSSVKIPIIKSTVLGASIDVGLIDVDRTHPEPSADEMEDWEIEPGVIAGSASNSDRDSENEHDIAYSSVYTTSAEAGIRVLGVHFQVIRITTGSLTLSPDIPFLRICSVATGKVQVQVGEHEFSIGAHGMWRVRAKENCVLVNRHSSEAVIHISTFNMS